MAKEIYISVDIEAAGDPTPDYSMLSIGACNVENISDQKYIELKPLNMNKVDSAIGVTGFTLEGLLKTGVRPTRAMEEFNEWVYEVSRPNIPVFTAFNAPFDWSFYNYYTRHFTGKNAFGINALDIKPYFMGKFNTTWGQTSKKHIPAIFIPDEPHTHNALDDAIEQTHIFNRIKAYPHNKLP